MNKSSIKTIVFLAGWGFKASIWGEIAARFPSYDCLLLNLPETLNTDELFHQLHQQIPHNAVLVGWSLGGLLAMRFSYHYPDKIKQMVLVSSIPKFVATKDWQGIPNEMMNKFIKFARFNVHDVQRKFIANYIHDSIDQHLIKDEELLLFHLSLLFTQNNRDLIELMNIPIHLVYGDMDVILPLSCYEQCKYPNVTHKKIEGANHAPFISHADEVTAYLTEILHAYG